MTRGHLRNHLVSKRHLNPLIYIIGIDGSGKTAHSKALCKELSNFGVNCIHVSPRSSLLRFMLHSKSSWFDQHDHFGPRNVMLPVLRERTLRKSTPTIFLRIPLTLLMIAYVFLTYLVTIRPILERQAVVSDRCFYDLFYNLWGKVSIVFARMFPKPTIGFVLDVPVSLAYSRMHSSTDKRIPRGYYEALRNHYLSFARQNGFHVVDASSDFRRSNQYITSCIKMSLKCGRNEQNA